MSLSGFMLFGVLGPQASDGISMLFLSCWYAVVWGKANVIPALICFGFPDG